MGTILGIIFYILYLALGTIVWYIIFDWFKNGGR